MYKKYQNYLANLTSDYKNTKVQAYTQSLDHSFKHCSVSFCKLATLTKKLTLI